MLGIFKGKQASTPSPEVETCAFYSVQRLITDKAVVAISPAADDLRFTQLFKLDYMGASEYEWGAFPKFMREVHAHRDTLQGLQVDIAGNDVFVVFSTHNNTLEHVVAQLTAIAAGRQHTQNGARFNRVVPKVEQKKPRKGSRAAREAEVEAYFRVEGWAEISLATFWTVLPMTLERYKQLIANSVAYLDAQKRLIEEKAS